MSRDTQMNISHTKIHTAIYGVFEKRFGRAINHSDTMTINQVLVLVDFGVWTGAKSFTKLKSVSSQSWPSERSMKSLKIS